MDNTQYNSSEPYVIHFPPERSIGLLYVDDGGEGVAHFEGGKGMATARGEVTLYPGKHLAFFAPTLYGESVKFSDQDLSYLAGVPGLNDLALDDTDVTDDGMRHIGQITGLYYLSLSATSVTDAGLSYLQRCIALRSLHLNFLRSTGVTDTGLSQLHSFYSAPLIRAQWVTYHRHRARPSSYVFAFPQHSDQTAVTDDGIVLVQSFPDLTRLGLSDTAITDNGMAHLRSCISLRDLRLAMTNITDAGIENLRNLTILGRSM